MGAHTNLYLMLDTGSNMKTLFAATILGVPIGFKCSHAVLLSVPTILLSVSLHMNILPKPLSISEKDSEARKDSPSYH